MKGLKLPAFKFPKSPTDFAKLAIILLVIFGGLSYLGVVSLPVVVESMKTKKAGKGSLKHDHIFDAAKKDHTHGSPVESE